jgi:hypothetical protein
MGAMDKNITSFIDIMANPLEKHFIEEWSKSWLEQMMQITKQTEFLWRYRAIASNLNLTMNVIFNYPKSTWNWKYVSQNPNLTIDIIKKHPHKPWNWLEISQHKNITMQMIIDNPQFQWNWKGIYHNPNLTIDFVLQHKWKKWDWDWIFRNVDIPMDMIVSCLHPIVNSSMQQYCLNKCVTEDVVEKHIDFGWDFNFLSQNSSISFDFALKHIDKPWKLRYFARRVDILQIEQYLDLFCASFSEVYFDITLNPNLTMEFVTKYYNTTWHACDLASNPAFTQKDLELLCKISNEQFPKYSYCSNPNMTEKFILEQYEKDGGCDMPYAHLQCESITLEFLLKNAHLNFHIDGTIALKRCDKMRESTIAHNIQKINLATIHEFHQQPELYIGCESVENVELVFMNCYLMQMIMRK